MGVGGGIRHDRMAQGGREAYMTASELHSKPIHPFQRVPGMLPLGGSVPQGQYLSPKDPRGSPDLGDSDVP